jgi:chemotaxis protein methyltransferase CheR
VSGIEEDDRVPALTDGEFTLFQELIRREAGIHLSDVKKPLLVGRLGRRLRDLGVRSFRAYYRRVREDDEERRVMLDRVSTNKTQFFREPAQFDFLEREVVPRWRADAARARRIRAWSAGCSTGEEAYSLAAVLLAGLPPAPAWDLEILATDLSSRVLEKARAAVWPVARAAEIPERYLRAFFLEGFGSQEGLMKAGPELRERVWFERANLVEASDAPAGPFDLVFCRNVLIYFDADTQARVVDTLLAHLAEGGYLFLGHAESAHAFAGGLTAVGPTVYQRSVGQRP